MLKCANTSKIEKEPYVIGVITNIERVEVPNKFKDKPIKIKTRFTLTIIEAYKEYGNKMDAANYNFPKFAGDSTLINKYEINQKVKIALTSSTERRIKTIELIEKFFTILYKTFLPAIENNSLPKLKPYIPDMDKL